MGSKRNRGRAATTPNLADWLATHLAGVPPVESHAAGRWVLKDAGLKVEVWSLEGDAALDALELDCSAARQALDHPEHEGNPICDFVVAWTRADHHRVALALVELKGGRADDVAKEAEVQLRATYELLDARLEAEARRLDWHLVVVAHKARSPASMGLDRDWRRRIGRGLIHAQIPRGRFAGEVNLRQLIATAPRAA